MAAALVGTVAGAMGSGGGGASGGGGGGQPDLLKGNINADRLEACLDAGMGGGGLVLPGNGTTVSPVFSDGAVLQRAPRRAALYGELGAGEKFVRVVVTDENDGAIAADVVAALDSRANTWKALLPPQGPGGPFKVTVVPGNGPNVTLSDILFGDVWFCAGQSNMALMTKDTITGEAFENEAGSGALDGKIRLLNFAGMEDRHLAATEPRFVMEPDTSPVSGTWFKPSILGQLREFGSTCAFFGAQLRERLDNPVPLGLIHNAVGGSQIEAWLDNANVRCCPHNVAGEPNPVVPPTTLFYGHVTPFVNMTVTGWVWYQGENNARGLPGGLPGKSVGYSCMLQQLIQLWRRSWSVEANTTAPDAPFGLVTLAPHTHEGNAHKMSHIREVQLEAGRALPNVFIAHAYDLPDPWPRLMISRSAGCVPAEDDGPDFAPHAQCAPLHASWQAPLDGDWYGSRVTGAGAIHPRAKRRVADRLAAAAAPLVEPGRPRVINPGVQSCAVVDGVVEIRFDVGDDALELRAGDNLPSHAFQECASSSEACQCRFERFDKEAGDWLCDYRAGNALQDLEPVHFTSEELLWEDVPGVEVVDEVTLQVTLRDSNSYALRFAWGHGGEACYAPEDDRFRSGFVPQPLRGCRLQSVANELPADPFFLDLTLCGSAHGTPSPTASPTSDEGAPSSPSLATRATASMAVVAAAAAVTTAATK